MITFIKKFFPTILLIGIIAFLSLASFKSLPSTPAIPNMDKIVHFCMYMALSFILLFDVLRTSHDRKVCIKKALPVFLISLCMGGLMELMQGYLTTTRSADWYDMLANACGALTGILLGCASLPGVIRLLFRKRH